MIFIPSPKIKTGRLAPSRLWLLFVFLTGWFALRGLDCRTRLLGGGFGLGRLLRRGDDAKAPVAEFVFGAFV